VLSRRFYQKLAKNFADQRPPVNSVQYPTWSAMVAVTADAIETTAAGFNREKFLLACGDAAALALAE
jgi:hypothetical protein